MQLRLLWLVLAGFLLGFAVSTLWEWFYFRRARMTLRDRRIRELEAMLHERARSAKEGSDLGVDEAPWVTPEYRSPGVFLETEEIREDSPDLVQDTETEDRPAGVEELADPETKLAGAKPAVQEVQFRSQTASPAFVSPKSASTERVISTSSRPKAQQPAPVQAVPVQPQTGNLSPTSPRARSADAPGRARRPDDYPDDLSKVKGIGDVYKRRLYAAGIYTWRQIAEGDQDTLRAATNAYPSSNVDEWPEQARRLAEKRGRLNAVYTGPPPDDLSQVNGIGPVSAQTLYKEGICTYEQLAATAPEQLAAIFPIAVAGDRPDFNSWIEQAVQLTNRQNTNR